MYIYIKLSGLLLFLLLILCYYTYHDTVIYIYTLCSLTVYKREMMYIYTFFVVGIGY